MTKKEMIIRTMMDHPEMSNHVIAKRVGCHPVYVGQVERNWLKDKPKDETQAEMFPEVEPVCLASTDTTNTIDAVLTERGSRYGKFEDHARITQAFKTFMFCELEANQKKLEPDQLEALDMIFHKIGRILNGDPNYADSWVDIAGYAKLVADRLEGNSR